MNSADDERQMCSTYGQPCPYAGAQCESRCVGLAARQVEDAPKPMGALGTKGQDDGE